MSIKLNHTIVHSRDKGESAAFLVEILGLPAPTPFGPFLTLQVDSEVVNGKRAISKTQAKALGEFFKVSRELFI
jgi:hypothetical protein